VNNITDNGLAAFLHSDVLMLYSDRLLAAGPIALLLAADHRPRPEHGHGSGFRGRFRRLRDQAPQGFDGEARGMSVSKFDVETAVHETMSVVMALAELVGASLVSPDRQAEGLVHFTMTPSQVDARLAMTTLASDKAVALRGLFLAYMRSERKEVGPSVAVSCLLQTISAIGPFAIVPTYLSRNSTSF
jgi:hypothetical protein